MAAAVEAKVSNAAWSAASATVVANFLLWLLARYMDADAASDPAVIGFVNFAVAGTAALVVGYYTKHTARKVVQVTETTVESVDVGEQPPVH